MKEYLVGYVLEGRIHTKEFENPNEAYRAFDQCYKCGVPCFERKGLIAGCQELYFSAMQYAYTQGVKIEYCHEENVYYDQDAYEGTISDKYGNVVHFSCSTYNGALTLN